MDDLLPSYESAIEQNPWIYIARYLPSEDLCSAALVCQKWHHVMTPQLWGNPASHFGTQNDTVYVALTRFKFALPYARLAVRELTHTLQLPPAHAEIYGGPHAEWLRDCLEYLPRLQCLIVNGLPFFDHASLLSLRRSSLRRQPNGLNSFPTFNLRLLDASSCTNTTSVGLAEALSHFPDLVSLDLSCTPAAKDVTVLSAFKYLRNLRVLNLRGLGLKDTDFAIIAPSIGTRVRSLDLSDNHLTDNSARLLLDHCVRETSVETHRTRVPLSPVEHEQSSEDTVAFEEASVVNHLRQKLTAGFVGSLAIERARDVGITHLFLSKNAVTVEGISGLLRSRRLQVLDVGILPSVLENPHTPVTGEPIDTLNLPGVSKLTSVFSEYASEKLQYLRVSYKIITEDAPVDAVSSPRAELSGSTIHGASQQAQELDTVGTPTFELDSINTAIIELPGDMSHIAELPASFQASQSHHQSEAEPPVVKQKASISTPQISVTNGLSEVNRGPEHAPEPVLIEPFPLFSQSGDQNEAFLQPGVSSRSRQNSTLYVEERRNRLDLRQSQENRLHPGMLSKVHTIVLTDVPIMTSKREVINRLIQYVKDAAEEAMIARQRAKHTYILPPGRSRATAEREYTQNLFALRRIVFEMAPPQALAKKISTSWRAYPTKSSTEDADSEAFWEAATYDFSFFGEEDCGYPSLTTGHALPLATMSGLEVATEQPEAAPRPEIEPSMKPLFDVVGEVGKFRKDRKAAYNNLVQMGELEPDVEGYWPGDITIVRKPVDPDAGELDCYGNRFESGWYYR